LWLRRVPTKSTGFFRDRIRGKTPGRLSPNNIMMMKSFIKINRNEILRRWREHVMSSYSSQGAAFMERERDRFANPVGASINDVTSHMLESLIEETDQSVYQEPLESFIKIRAVQEYTASQAVGFVFMLKNAIKETPGFEATFKEASEEQFTVLNRIDRMALDAFDCYAACREKLCDIAMNEFKRRNHKIMERLGLS
jgi:hypothetical protein